MLKVALCGNPNVGKTTLFNRLTGIRQKVANYPGVTVEKREGVVELGKKKVSIVDLPGIYSLSSFSPEEKIAEQFLREENPDLVINIVDGSNLSKNLYLTLQLLEIGVPVVLFVNKMDVVTQSGREKIDLEELSESLGIPVVSGIARKGKGIDQLRKAISSGAVSNGKVQYSPEVERVIAELVSSSEESITHGDAARMIEERRLPADMDIENGFMVKARCRKIDEIASRSVSRIGEGKRHFTDLLDRVLLNRYLGIPIFFLLMYLLFEMVFTLGDPMMGWIEDGFAFLGSWVGSFWAEGSDSILKSLIVDGIIGGVGGVLVFTPNIFLMFLGIAFLEDSGYMARVAVIMDNWMGKTGLSGKSFVPMVLGFGCSVPAIMGARIVENRFERLTTLFVTPFLSCSARLPVHLLLVGAFIPAAYQSSALFAIYIFSGVIAFAAAKLMRKTFLKGKKSPLLMELPLYSMPLPQSLILHTWERGKHFLKKAGSVLLAASILIWVLSYFPRYEADPALNLSEEDVAAHQIENSYIGMIGKGVEPAFKMIGGDWKVGSATISALAAKEVFVSQLGILFSLGETDEGSKALQKKLSERYSLAAALALIVLLLLSAPCIATFAMVRAETESWIWPTAQYVFMTGVAYVLAVITYGVVNLIS